MHNVTEQFDNLVAIRVAAQLLPGTASPFTLRDLADMRLQTKRNLTVALLLLREDEREETIESLDELYDGQAREDLEALL